MLEEETTVGYSQFHSMQLSLNKRLSSRFTLLSSYTLAKNTGLAVAQSEGGQGTRDPFHYNVDRGRLDFDVRHPFVTSGIWELPALKGRASPLRFLFGGWEANGILTLQSGLPFTVRSGVDNSFFGIGSDTADLVGDPRLDTSRARKDLIARYFNTAAFAPNARFTTGTAGLNILEGPGAVYSDLGLDKSFSLRERLALHFRAEAFNALNRVNLGNPTVTQSSPNFGRILSAGDPRVIQLALKLKF